MHTTGKQLFCGLIMLALTTCFGHSQVYGSDHSSYSKCNGIYIRGFGGLNSAQRPKWNGAKYSTSNGYVVGAALGYQLTCLALEGEFSYRHNTVNQLKVDLLDINISGDVQQFCGFGNLLVNIPIVYCLAPYAGAGVGYRHIKPGVNFDEGSDTSFRNFVDSADEWGVYQLIGGLHFAASRLMGLQLEYRYVDGWSNTRCRNHTVDLGISVHF